MTVGAGVPGKPLERSRTVSQVGERRLIAELTRMAAAGPAGADVVIGSGDDAAVIDATGATVISTDTVVQGRHFRFEWSDPQTVGARAVVAAAADVAAMGARTTGLVASIACPTSTTVATVLDLGAGIVDATDRLGARVLGGDLVAADQVVLTVTVVGRLDGGTPVTIDGARAGDVLAVSGTGLGFAAAGLDLLHSAQPGGDDELVDAHRLLVDAFRLPSPDLGQGPVAAAAGAHAMTDISDGLVEELITMSTASGVRLEVDSARLPVEPELRSAAGALEMEPLDWVLTGGEDHLLLAAFAETDVPPGWTLIGTVTDGAGVRVDGAPVDREGWQAFDG